MDLFEHDIDREFVLSENEKRRVEAVLEKLVSESTDHGISLIALKNARISKAALVKLAREGHSNASAVLAELNLRGILEEAKNPDTKEEVATEMLARLVVCHVPTIRRRATHLLLKLNSEKLMEVLVEKSVSSDLRNIIFSDIVGDDEVYLRVLLRILRNPSASQEVRDKIVQRILRIRKLIEENSAQIIDWNHRIEDLQKRKKIKFQTIQKFHREVNESLVEFQTIPSFIMDLKFDVELAFENLKDSVGFE